MRGGRSAGGSTRNAGAGCAGRATGRTGLSRSGAEWSGDAAAPHAETGRWSATAQGGAAECSGAERKPGRVGGVKFEPEVVPPEPAETGRPEAEPMRPNGERTHTAKRTGGQSAEAEPARSGREQALRAGVAGTAAGAEEGRSRSRLPGAAQPAERRTRTGADGQVERSAPGSSRSGNLPRERTAEAGCGACGTPAAGGSERAGCPEAEPKRACDCTGRRGGVSTRGFCRSLRRLYPEVARSCRRPGQAR